MVFFGNLISKISNTFEFDFNELSINNNNNNNNNIPKILHLIWVGDNDEPVYLFDHLNKWISLLPDWEIMLWTNNDMTTKHFPLNIIYLLDKVKMGAQKADIMRYFIMEKYGGVYMDADVEPHSCLNPLINQLPEAEVILCHDMELTWNYISIGFFASIPNHSLFKIACDLCNSVKINTGGDIYIHTGHALLGNALNLFVKKQEPSIFLLPSKYFYHNQDINKKFGSHLYKKEW